MSRKIAIIGGGNLGAAIADGLIQSEFSRPVEITITRRNLASLGRFAERGCMVHSDNKKAVRESEIIILAVKPYNYAEIIKELKAVFNPKKHVVVSVVTGAWIEQLQAAIGKPVPVIRAMPNTAIAIQQSMTCLSHSGASASQLNYIQQLFDQLGKTVMIDEKLMDAATILGACGTAYAMRYIRANIQGGIEIGFDAVKAASLVETLKSAGPFTVFAPTNAAFNALPAGTVDNLLKPEMKADLAGVLTYHVVAGAVKAADLKDGQKIKTVQGGELTVSIKDGKVMINGANVTIADVISSNGVTHVIDAVLLPKK